MKITYNGNEYDLHWSYRVQWLFEEYANKSIDQASTTKDTNTIFYCVFLATMIYNHVECDMTIDDFTNWVDDNGGQELFIEFIKWFYKKAEQQKKLVNKKAKNKETVEVDPNI